jgi:hypothetical protein
MPRVDAISNSGRSSGNRTIILVPNNAYSGFKYLEERDLMNALDCRQGEQSLFSTLRPSFNRPGALI